MKGTERYPDSKKRSAYHEAGHSLLLCLVTWKKTPDQRAPFAGLIFGHDCSVGSGLSLPEDVTDPWNDAQVLLGGPAADVIVYGDTPSEKHEDCVRANRLLRGMRVRIKVADAFAVTRDLVQRHRDLLETFMDAFHSRGVIIGNDIWRLFEDNLSIVSMNHRSSARQQRTPPPTLRF